MQNTAFKESLSTEITFENYLRNYFKNHKQLDGSYETREYFENYRVRLNRKGGLSLRTTTCLNITAATIPLKQTENISFADFRHLILNKKFADINETLADVFQGSFDN